LCSLPAINNAVAAIAAIINIAFILIIFVVN
jgi:hypothetical protein